MRPLLLVAVLSGMTAPALGMNWEGHDDDWHKDISFAKAFRDAVSASPLERPLPLCSEKIDNVYDQVRIAGKNCVSGQIPSGDKAKPAK